ncbi:MAG: plasmid stabilization protein, partial [Pseudonocardia sp.]|nr:plasmid stabilization protein [Pseudonocardia sp.]
RAQAVESEQASRTSTEDVSPQHRGGKRSHTGAQGRTGDQLYEDAKRQHVEGRSSMSKDELQDAVED